MDPARLLPPVIGTAEIVGDTVYVNFGGLILTVCAPCGCKAHYDTSEFATQRPMCSVESCLTEDCDFEWDESEKAARELLATRPLAEAAECASIEMHFDLGGEA